MVVAAQMTAAQQPLQPLQPERTRRPPHERALLRLRVRPGNTLAPTAQLPNCPAAGDRIDAGLDSNANGLLVALAITSMQYDCNGGAGATGWASLVRLDSEALGSNCATGRTKASAGADVNRNGVLDNEEILNPPRYGKPLSFVQPARRALRVRLGLRVPRVH